MGNMKYEIFQYEQIYKEVYISSLHHHYILYGGYRTIDNMRIKFV